MPTAGEYEIEFFWSDGFQPDADHQESVWWDNGSVCMVGLGDLEVSIYVEGDTKIYDRDTEDTYRRSSEFPEDLSTDKALQKASEGALPRLDWQNNSWFDIYTSDGEHLDLVTHMADEAFNTACQYLIEQFVNLCKIENNQTPQIEERKVVVLDLE